LLQILNSDVSDAVHDFLTLFRHIEGFSMPRVGSEGECEVDRRSKLQGGLLFNSSVAKVFHHIIITTGTCKNLSLLAIAWMDVVSEHLRHWDRPAAEARSGLRQEIQEKVMRRVFGKLHFFCCHCRSDYIFHYCTYPTTCMCWAAVVPVSTPSL
jgi:hypothetical protein